MTDLGRSHGVQVRTKTGQSRGPLSVTPSGLPKRGSVTVWDPQQRQFMDTSEVGGPIDCVD